MESEKRINWLSLFIKIVIIFIFTLIIVWLVTKLIGAGKLSKEFKNNINNLEKVSIEYFKTIDLPLKKGKSIKITLEELLNKKLIISTSNEFDNKCDSKNSFSNITREEKKYIITTTLKCGKEKDTIKEDFSLSDCRNCSSKKEETENKKENDTSNNKENISNNNEKTEKIYYEHIKETKEYSKWMSGTLSGENIENKYKYYGVEYQTYHTIGIIPKKSQSTEYILKLNKVPNKKYYFTTIKDAANFQCEEEKKYLNETKVTIYTGNKGNIPKKNISKYSLGDSNFVYKLYPYYRDGSFYIRITITIKNTEGIKTYYDSKLKEYAYLIPIKIKVKFASDEIKDTKPSGNYETIPYYRYVTTKKKTIWSTDKYIKGYTKTGNTKTK